MKKLDIYNKKNINGGISQAAIFAIIASIGIGVNIISSIATGILNMQANKKNSNKENKTFNINYQNQSSYVY